MHFNISQHQQNTNLIWTTLVIILTLLVVFILFCIKQSKKPKYDYRKDFNHGVLCYMVEKRRFIFYIPIKNGLCFEEHDAVIKVEKLNNSNPLNK